MEYQLGEELVDDIRRKRRGRKERRRKGRSWSRKRRKKGIRTSRRTKRRGGGGKVQSLYDDLDPLDISFAGEIPGREQAGTEMKEEQTRRAAETK
ncbi:hypothetical protein PoB_007246900 [Plakobranchus ocellatus]|uniref:Uncharacterized protein n=1 Tax=Plakobranchus ocellatus TaxID=259542 RepID=A0AAV4DP73_9GAST|nr:hypothetical protein PoB_007246900 [Plakobranchus ocellatus]